MQRGLELGGQVVLGIDPGTVSTGLCLCSSAGEIIELWSIKTPNGLALDARLRYIRAGLERVLSAIEGEYGVPDTVVEDGILRSKPMACAALGEVRGVIIAEVCRRGWEYRRLSPMSWKSLLSQSEKKMKKDKLYVAYWSRYLEQAFKTADEVDASMVARRAALGRR